MSGDSTMASIANFLKDFIIILGFCTHISSSSNDNGMKLPKDGELVVQLTIPNENVYSLRLLMAFRQLNVTQGSADYCLLDTFEPYCSQEQVVIIDSATYGRTKNSRCIQHGTGRVGCFVDVKNVMESLCSGRKSCSVPVVQRSLLSTRPCGDLAASLTVAYSCLKVISNHHTECSSSSKMTITSDQGFLSSDLVSHGGPGSRSCPWKLRSESGKQFNVTIHTYSSNELQDGTHPPVCFEAVTIKERAKEMKTLICPSDPKVKQVMISDGNVIELTFPPASVMDSRAFIVQFQASGCQNPKVPDSAHFNRRGHTVEVKCNRTRISWQLTCVNNKWEGEDKECSEGWMFSSVLGTEESPPLGILLIVVTGIAMGVLIGGFLLYLAINAFKRYHGLLPGQQIQNPSYEKPLYNPNNKLANYNDRTIQQSSMIYGTNRRSYPNRQMLPPVPPPHADTAQMRPPSEISEVNRQSHIYETPLFSSL